MSPQSFSLPSGYDGFFTACDLSESDDLDSNIHTSSLLLHNEDMIFSITILHQNTVLENSHIFMVMIGCLISGPNLSKIISWSCILYRGFSKQKSENSTKNPAKMKTNTTFCLQHQLNQANFPHLPQTLKHFALASLRRTEFFPCQANPPTRSPA